jgi:hypothetical protein
LRAAHPGKAVEVWAEDEARLGLEPITRRVWWLKGCRPTSSGRTKYEWLYVYGFAADLGRTTGSIDAMAARFRLRSLGRRARQSQTRRERNRSTRGEPT